MQGFDLETLIRWAIVVPATPLQQGRFGCGGRCMSVRVFLSVQTLLSPPWGLFFHGNGLGELGDL
jgi:hypothetical protein